MAKKHKYTKGELDEYGKLLDSDPDYHGATDHLDKDGNYDYTKLKAIKRRDEKGGLDMALMLREKYGTKPKGAKLM